MDTLLETKQDTWRFRVREDKFNPPHLPRNKLMIFRLDVRHKVWKKI
ncbi:9765_t:CDS:2 [Paraglomus occultum]|uniref:9765_t:CDS:1 n=1 Tax=Paraglomus occultum TaxID=144539 RepID=A0A9N8WLB1_9GLOM|nr:9765_t:CDS:2 [Paraglomus occultum]